MHVAETVKNALAEELQAEIRELMAEASRRTQQVKLRVNDVVAQYGFARSTVYNLMKDGTLPYTQVRGMRLIAREDADALAPSRRQA